MCLNYYLNSDAEFDDVAAGHMLSNESETKLDDEQCLVRENFSRMDDYWNVKFDVCHVIRLVAFFQYHHQVYAKQSKVHWLSRLALVVLCTLLQPLSENRQSTDFH